MPVEPVVGLRCEREVEPGGVRELRHHLARVVPRIGAGSRLVPERGMQLLPDRPQPVDVGVVQEEDRVVHRGRGIAHLPGLATYPAVDTVMQ
jgi:hypothetical protein